MPKTAHCIRATSRCGCSQRDVAEAIALSVDAPPERHYDVFFVNSRNRWGYRDLSHAEEAVGFVPQDAAEDHR